MGTRRGQLLSRWLRVIVVSLLAVFGPLSLISTPAQSQAANDYLAQPISTAAKAPNVVVDGNPLSSDVPPIIEDGRTLAPLRAIFEALGANVQFDPVTNTVIATKGITTISLQIGSSQAKVNDKTIRLDVPARIINERTLVPLRFISEALGAIVDWDDVTQTVKITSSTQPPITSNQNTKPEIINKEYEWKFDGKEWTWKIGCDSKFYQYFKNLKRVKNVDDYSVYVTNPYDDSYISQLIDRLKETKEKYNYSDRKMVDFAVSFVQSLVYVPDDISTGYDEYPKYPLETLIENGGDCEDTAILMVSILKKMGYEVVLVHYPGQHTAVGVKGSADIPGSYFEYNGTRYYYLETTGEGWEIGQMPDRYKNSKAKLLFLDPKPIITFSWETYDAPNTKIRVTVNNEGTGTANNTYVYVAFDAGNNLVYNPVSSKKYDLKPMSQVVYDLNLKYPRNVYTRIIVKVISNGVLMAQSTSEWFNTN